MVIYNSLGILVQCICPGGVLTDMLSKILDKAKQSIHTPTPDAFVKQALRSLGFSSIRSAGFWSHALLIKSGILECTGLMKKGNQRHMLAKLKEK